MKMADWVKFLHSFLELSNCPILQDKGKVSALEAKLKAEGDTRFTASGRTRTTSRTLTGKSNASRARNRNERGVLHLGVLALNSTPHPACATFSPVKAEKGFTSLAFITNYLISLPSAASGDFTRAR